MRKLELYCGCPNDCSKCKKPKDLRRKCIFHCPYAYSVTFCGWVRVKVVEEGGRNEKHE